MKRFLLIIIFMSITSISGCSGFNGSDSTYPVATDTARRIKHGKLTDKGGLKINLFGDKDSSDSGGGIGVNSFLWSASLDTLSFLPLSSVDPNGGVIITDWYEDPESQGEKFKMNVLIFGKKLHAGGLKLSVFKKVKDENGVWQDSAVDKMTARKLEDRILTRARELKIKASIE